MKPKQTLFIISLVSIFTISKAQNVGIGTTTPASSAQLDVTSTSKGFLPPRMSIAQRDSIVPVAGLMIFCLDDNGISGEWQGFNGTKWVTLCGGEITVTKGVTICTQVWSKKNLDVVTYRNGDSIPHVKDPEIWRYLKTGAYCYYNNDSINYGHLGKLYNWYAVSDPRGLAPDGWHIPSDEDWRKLITCLGGDSIAGGAMKEIGVNYWTVPNLGATNSSGFSALPGGRRWNQATFQSTRDIGYWWTSTEKFTSSGLGCILSAGDGIIRSNYDYPKHFGFSVRCIKD